MKMNWGFNIAAFYIFFVLILLVVVFIFMNHDVGLVTNDYYAKEIAYQAEIDKMKRTEALSEQLEILSEPIQVRFSFPKIFAHSDITGTIHFYRPSDKTKDFVIKIGADSSGMQVIRTEKIDKGLWKIKVNWTVKDASYFN